MVSNKVVIGGLVVVIIIALAGLLAVYPGLVTTPQTSGTILVYGSVDAEDLAPLIVEFEKKFPDLKVEYVRGSPSEVFTRITTELSAGQKSADLTLVSFPGTLQLINEGIYRPYVSSQASAYPSEMKHPEGIYTSVVLLGQVITYNTNLISKEDLPKRLADLTDPKWKGKITMHDYTTGTTSTQIWASLAERIGEKGVIDFLTNLEKNVNPVLQRSTGVQTDEVVRGEYSIGIVAQLHDVVKARLAGAPIDVLQLEDFPLMLSPTPAAILRDAENPRGAEVFVDFLLSDEGQRIIGNVEVRFPAKPGVDAQFSIEENIPEGMEVFQYPTEKVFKEVDVWTDRFKGIAAGVF